MAPQFNRDTELGREKVPSEIWPFYCEALPTAPRKGMLQYNSMMCSSSWDPVNVMLQCKENVDQKKVTTSFNWSYTCRTKMKM